LINALNDLDEPVTEGWVDTVQIEEHPPAFSPAPAEFIVLLKLALALKQ
jgi:hypothetical protein